MTREEVSDLLERMAEGDEAATQRLFQLLARQDPATQVLFLEAVQHADDDSLREQLILTLADDSLPAARSPRPAESAEPAEATGTTQPSAPESHDLIAALGDSKREVRLHAARALGERRETTAVGSLVRALGDAHRPVAGAAEQALELIGSPAVPALVEALKSSNEQVRWYAAKALAAIQDPRAVHAQIEALNDPNYGVRWLAAEGLAAEGPPALEPLLQALSARKPTAWFRQGAAHVLNKIGHPDPRVRDELRTVADQIKRGPAADIPLLARNTLSRLLQSR